MRIRPGRRWHHKPSTLLERMAVDTGGHKPRCKSLEIRGAEVVHALLRAAATLSTNLGASFWKHRRSEVAHALLRAASALVPTPRDRKNVECRQEWRHGTQECVRHQQSRPSDRTGQKVCGARNLCGKRRRVGRLKIGRRMKSCPTTDVGPPVLSTACGKVCGEWRRGTQECVRHWLLSATIAPTARGLWCQRR